MISSLAVLLAYSSYQSAALVGMALWGLGMGAQESIMKAIVVMIVPIEVRGSAYGIFYVGYGLAWFAGSALMGVLYDLQISALVIFSISTQLLAVVVLFWISRHQVRVG